MGFKVFEEPVDKILIRFYSVPFSVCIEWFVSKK